MNYRFDLIIVGDSLEGFNTLKKIATVNPNIKIAFISRKFKSSTTYDFVNVECIQEEVELINYGKRLFGCYLKNGFRLFSTHLILATGIKYEPLIVENKKVPNVYNTVNDLPKNTKMQQAVVICRTEAEAKLAIIISKKYKHVYLCLEGLAPPASEKVLKKLEDLENLAILPNANIKKVNSNKGQLTSVELDNYSIITCSAIFIKTPAMPETALVSNQIIEKVLSGYCKTKENLESSLVPKFFALGRCAIKNTKKMNDSLIKTILKDFQEE